MKQTILDMEAYARENNIPIIEKDSITFIMKYIKLNNVKNILEIGSAIGYSSILMASVASDIKITTIEKDQTRYLECLKNVKKCGLEKNIDVVFQDALDLNLSGNYDLIFIDAAKGQNTKFFEKFSYFLSDKGVIITDNINFHGYVNSKKEIESKNLNSLVEKIRDYIEFLKSNKEYTTKFYDIGDGLAVSFKNKNE
jgi:predicted O-methyltransferase YrrM